MAVKAWDRDMYVYWFRGILYGVLPCIFKVLVTGTTQGRKTTF